MGRATSIYYTATCKITPSKAKNPNIICQIGPSNCRTLKASAKETRRIPKTYQNVRKSPAILANGSSILKY